MVSVFCWYLLWVCKYMSIYILCYEINTASHIHLVILLRLLLVRNILSIFVFQLQGKSRLYFLMKPRYKTTQTAGFGFLLERKTITVT